MTSRARDLSKFVIANFIPLDNANIKANASRIITLNSAREMGRIVHINRDMQSGFATPFEVYFSNGYTIRMKGGNVDGYSAAMSFVPEIKLGAVFLVNCPSLFCACLYVQPQQTSSLSCGKPTR